MGGSLSFWLNGRGLQILHLESEIAAKRPTTDARGSITRESWKCKAIYQQFVQLYLSLGIEKDDYSVPYRHISDAHRHADHTLTGRFMRRISYCRGYSSRGVSY